MFATAALASAIVGVVAKGPVEAWRLFSPTDARFAVRMPGLATELVEEVETDLAKVVRHTYTCSGNQTLWQVSSVDLAREMLLGVTSADLLTMAMESSRRNAADQIIDESRGYRDGAPYRSFRVVPRLGPVVSNMVVLDGARLYHLQVVSRPDRFRQVGTRSFFDSFTLSR